MTVALQPQPHTQPLGRCGVAPGLGWVGPALPALARARAVRPRVGPRRLAARGPLGYRANVTRAPAPAIPASGPSALGALDDAALVAELVRGREDALGELYDRYGDLLMAVAMRILKDAREAEDLLHDVFVEAWRRAADFDPARGTVRAWLVTRARSRALDRVKSPGRVRAVALDTVEERAAADDGGDGADHERLRRAVATLSADQRVVMELAYFEGLSSSGIAERLGIPMGTVKSRMAAGLARLRTAMGAS